jgi:phage I-like protein
VKVSHLVIATAPLPEGVPTEFRLLKRGVNQYDSGDEIIWDDASAEETLKRYRMRGVDLMADYEHQTLVEPPVEAPASAKRWVPEVRGGDLVATSIAWTDKAKAYLAAGEYRYFSIACRVNTKTKRCVQLINFALTNNPAGHGITALVAASQRFSGEEPDQDGENMKTIIVALGLGAETEEATAIAKASTLAKLERDVLDVTKAKSLDEARGTLVAFAQANEQVIALNAKIRASEFDALVKEGMTARKLSPAQSKGDWLATMRAREGGVSELKEFLATAPQLIDKGGEAPREGGPSGEPEISPQELEIARKLVGTNPVVLKAHLEQLRTYKARRAAGEPLAEAVMTATSRKAS